MSTVNQPSLDLTERLEDDDVEGGEDDDGAELGGDERVDAVEGGVVPADCQQLYQGANNEGFDTK